MSKAPEETLTIGVVSTLTKLTERENTSQELKF